jgi:hypothetical protein
MIFLIWVLYNLFIFVLDLMSLNFLIAIFSQSYESIMDRQIEAIIESTIELNQECLQELVHDNVDVQAEVDVIVMQTAVNLNADSEWDGIAQTIKKSLGKVQTEVEDVKNKLTVQNAKLDNILAMITEKKVEATLVQNE